MGRRNDKMVIKVGTIANEDKMNRGNHKLISICDTPSRGIFLCFSIIHFDTVRLQLVGESLQLLIIGFGYLYWFSTCPPHAVDVAVGLPLTLRSNECTPPAETMARWSKGASIDPGRLVKQCNLCYGVLFSADRCGWFRRMTSMPSSLSSPSLVCRMPDDRKDGGHSGPSTTKR